MNAESYLVFHAGEHDYAIHELDVLKISAMRNITPLPKQLPHVCGLLSTQEEIITVADCNSFYFQKAVQHPQYLIIVRFQASKLCFVANTVLGSRKIDENSWQRQESSPTIYCETPSGICYLVQLENYRREQRDQHQ